MQQFQKMSLKIEAVEKSLPKFMTTIFIELPLNFFVIIGSRRSSVVEPAPRDTPVLRGCDFIEGLC